LTARPATEDDRRWIVDLLSRPEVVRSLAVTAADETAKALTRCFAGATDEGVHVLEADGCPVAVLRWTVRNRRSRIAVVQGLAVDPAARGHGYGAALVRAVVEHLAGERDIHRIEAEAFASNEASLTTFLRCGFEREGVRRQAYDREGAWQTTVLLGYLSDAAPRSTRPPSPGAAGRSASRDASA
jgi:RimJ/RimL family protein N-acetyltransferase